MKMPWSGILIQDFSRYIWHFRAAQPHMRLFACLPHQPPKHLYSRDQYWTWFILSCHFLLLLFCWNEQYPFPSLHSDWAFIFSHFKTGNVCLTFCWNQQLHFTFSVKTFYAIMLKKKKRKQNDLHNAKFVIWMTNRTVATYFFHNYGHNWLEKNRGFCHPEPVTWMTEIARNKSSP